MNVLVCLKFVVSFFNKMQHSTKFCKNYLAKLLSVKWKHKEKTSTTYNFPIIMNLSQLLSSIRYKLSVDLDKGCWNKPHDIKTLPTL